MLIVQVCIVIVTYLHLNHNIMMIIVTYLIIASHFYSTITILAFILNRVFSNYDTFCQKSLKLCSYYGRILIQYYNNLILNLQYQRVTRRNGSQKWTKYDKNRILHIIIGSYFLLCSNEIQKTTNPNPTEYGNTMDRAIIINFARRFDLAIFGRLH